MSVVHLLSHHDQEDARQDAWVAAREKGHEDDPRYVNGCVRICAIEIMRRNDRQREVGRQFQTTHVPVARIAGGVSSHGTLYEHGGDTHLLPFDVLKTTAVLHGDEYRQQLRAKARARARRKRAERVGS